MKFPPIRTLDTSKTPQAGDARITAPVLASADLARIARQIEAIEASRSGDTKCAAKRAAGPGTKPTLVPATPLPLRAKPQDATAQTPAQMAAAIRSARTNTGLSQIELAAKLKTSQANIVRLEKGRSQPSTRTLQRIAKATGHKLTISFIRG